MADPTTYLSICEQRELGNDSPLRQLLGEISHQDMETLAFMFNYQDDAIIPGAARVCAQLDDSEWSNSFSLDSLEINQSFAVDHPTRGVMEVGFIIKAAPGKLGKYTKIVRFMPRFAVINKLEVPVRMQQPTGFAGRRLEVPVSADHVRPFHLPDCNGDRKLAIKVAEGDWDHTVAFSVDNLGAHTLAVKHMVNLSTQDHINTRGQAEYISHLPPQEIGLYLETDWQEENIVVKGYKRGSYASTDTDIQVGDVLLAVDGVEYTGSQFDEALAAIKEKLKSDGCELKFRTVEEKLRLIRRHGARSQASLKRLTASPTVPATAAAAASHPSLATHLRRRMADDSSHSYDQVANEPGFLSDLEEGLGGLGAGGFDISSGMLLTARSTDGGMRGMMEGAEEEENSDLQLLPLRVELRQCEASVLIVIQQADDKACAEYRINNASPSHVIYYKQKGISGNRWNVLLPGQEKNYIWEDPFRSHKLVIRGGSNLLCPEERKEQDTSFLSALCTGIGQKLIMNPFHFLSDTDNVTAFVSFDEIGFKGRLPLANSK